MDPWKGFEWYKLDSILKEKGTESYGLSDMIISNWNRDSEVFNTTLKMNEGKKSTEKQLTNFFMEWNKRTESDTQEYWETNPEWKKLKENEPEICYITNRFHKIKSMHRALIQMKKEYEQSQTHEGLKDTWIMEIDSIDKPLETLTRMHEALINTLDNFYASERAAYMAQFKSTQDCSEQFDYEVYTDKVKGHIANEMKTEWNEYHANSVQEEEKTTTHRSLCKGKGEKANNVQRAEETTHHRLGEVKSSKPRLAAKFCAKLSGLFKSRKDNKVNPEQNEGPS